MASLYLTDAERIRVEVLIAADLALGDEPADAADDGYPGGIDPYDAYEYDLVDDASLPESAW